MERIGLCLSGGGARGPYQVGVAKALEELGLFSQIFAFSGTSIGAVNAVLLAGSGVSETEKMWMEMSDQDIRSTEGTFRRILRENFRLAERGVYDISALRGILESHVNFPVLHVRRVYVTIARGGSPREGIIGLMKSYYQHVFKKEPRVEYPLLSDYSDSEIVDRLMASCSIPIVFPPVRLEDTNFYDGGVYDNVPVDPLVECGCKTILVGHLFKTQKIDPNRYPGIRIIEIHHRTSLGGMLNFSTHRVESLIQFGYEDTMDRLRKNPIPDLS
jgi:NTE family protein